MTELLILRVADAPQQPWHNGGGSTRQLFAWPAGGAWQLRISLADIDQDGPFSALAGIDRWFAVVEGAGVDLALPGDAAPLRLDTASAPLAFAGEAAPGCKLVDGATRDLNLMLRRGAGQAAMQRARPGQPWTSAAPLRALFSTAAVQLQIDQRPPLPVPAWSLAVCAPAPHQRWTLQPAPAATPQPASACWLEFQPSEGA